jgi:hypothetical protein
VNGPDCPQQGQPYTRPHVNAQRVIDDNDVDEPPIEDPNLKLTMRMMDKTIILNQTEQMLFQRGRMMATITMMMRMRMASAFLPCEFK